MTAIPTALRGGWNRCGGCLRCAPGQARPPSKPSGVVIRPAETPAGRRRGCSRTEGHREGVRTLFVGWDRQEQSGHFRKPLLTVSHDLPFCQRLPRLDRGPRPIHVRLLTAGQREIVRRHALNPSDSRRSMADRGSRPGTRCSRICCHAANGAGFHGQREYPEQIRGHRAQAGRQRSLTASAGAAKRSAAGSRWA
jgi:hypothetical protein